MTTEGGMEKHDRPRSRGQDDPATGTAIIFVAIPVEYGAVISRLQNLEELEGPDHHTFELGFAEATDGIWKVVLVETGDGNNKAAAYVAKCIAQFKPDITVFCGVAGGVKDVVLGDVVVGDTIYFYDRIKDDDFVRARPTDTIQANETLLQAARHVARIHMREPTPPYKVFVKPIATGGALVANPKGAVAEMIGKNYNDSLAVETEGSGYMMSAHIFEKPAIVVRGASDLLTDKAVTDRAGWQKKAAENAADFVVKLLKRLHLPPRPLAEHTSISWDEAVYTLMPLNRKIESQFAPDIVVTMSGPGSWAAFYGMILRTRNIPVVTAVTFPISSEQESAYLRVRDALASDCWIELRTTKWLIYIPDIFKKLPLATKILLFDDRIVSGESQILLSSWLKERGFENVRTAALFISAAGVTTSVSPDFVGRSVGRDFTMPWGPKRGRT